MVAVVVYQPGSPAAAAVARSVAGRLVEQLHVTVLPAGDVAMPRRGVELMVVVTDGERAYDERLRGSLEALPDDGRRVVRVSLGGRADEPWAWLDDPGGSRSLSREAVERLAQQVGMPVVPRVLLEHVHEDPAQAEPSVAVP